jgi:hypothetical protein
MDVLPSGARRRWITLSQKGACGAWYETGEAWDEAEEAWDRTMMPARIITENDEEEEA